MPQCKCAVLLRLLFGRSGLFYFACVHDITSLERRPHDTTLHYTACWIFRPQSWGRRVEGKLLVAKPFQLRGLVVVSYSSLLKITQFFCGAPQGVSMTARLRRQTHCLAMRWTLPALLRIAQGDSVLSLFLSMLE